ncbi:MAG: PSD1 and planctomycete cytochrome C domain-containing protein [Planctomycetaceae bacterium]|nr:PSD1 and planctomycete cytochrome C domain-containing protein [Planctomycetaceae bacterium]
MRWIGLPILVVLSFGSLRAAEEDKEGIELFEKKIRPVLVERCYECHSAKAKKVEGNLLLDSRETARKGGDLGPAIVPGDLEKSLLIQAIRYTDENLQMPPKEKGRLPAEVVADFESWVKRGAPDPRDSEAPAATTVDIEAARQRWPYTPPVEPAIPAVKNAAWPRNPIDHFILAKLEEKGLSPAPDADPRTLLRRVSYDLIGLPPSVEELEEFLSLPPSLRPSVSPSDHQDGEKAWSATIERLLASPHYGERWGRHWLDVVRYADTAGDNSDYPIPQMYRYRNWVIDAVNADMPYDRFIREQLAGDLLPADSQEQKHRQIIATGYIANARRFGSRVDDYPQHLTIEDTIDNLGRAFLGHTLNCARCHNHKFDPITTEDYYAIYGIFHSTRYPWPGIELEKRQRDFVPLADGEIVAAALAERKRIDDQLLAEVKAAEEAKKAADKEAKEAQTRLDELQKQSDAGEDQRKAAESDVEAAKKKAADLDAQLKAAKKKREGAELSPLPFELAYAVAEGKKIENCKVQLKGDPERLGSEVVRRFPLVLGGQALPSEEKGSGRLELADWIANPANPLTARVMVNRIWQQHFGRGLVATPNDFGKQGQAPSHPELLDWLALRFMESGWSVKAMHRLMVSSRSYQQTSDFRFQISDLKAGDEHNLKSEIRNLKWPDLFSPFPRRRLDAESIRDTLLVLGGNLDRTPGQAHPFPPQKDWDFTQHKPFKAVYDTNRRSVYLMTQRIQRHPFLAIFDGPDTGASTASRTTSTTTLQALYFLNDPFVHEQAGKLAARIRETKPNDAERIDLAYTLLFARPATDEEKTLGQEYLKKVGDAGWESYVRVLMRANEFVYLN